MDRGILESEITERCRWLAEETRRVFSLPAKDKDDCLFDLHYDACEVATDIKRLEEINSYKVPDWYKFLQGKGFDFRRSHWHGGWLDHVTFLSLGGKEYFISEPYAVDAVDLAEILGLCKDFSLEVTITGESQHFSGRCLRIMITTKENFDAWKLKILHCNRGYQ